MTGSQGLRCFAFVIAAATCGVGCGSSNSGTPAGGGSGGGGATGSGGTTGTGGQAGTGTGTGGAAGTGGASGSGGGGGVGGAAGHPGGGGGTAGGGAGGGVPCFTTTCASGQVCVYGTVIPNMGNAYTTYTCGDNPCGADPLSCSCARALCVGPGAASCTGVSGTTLMCTFESVCASPETLIATPTGERRITDILPGDLVYSADGNALRAVPVLRIGQTPVYHHHVMRVALADGAVLEMSAGHPTADGRTFGQLRAGDVLDGVAIVSSELVPYRFSRTYDILPASRTGTYVAAGRLVGSTLSP